MWELWDLQELQEPRGVQELWELLELQELEEQPDILPLNENAQIVERPGGPTFFGPGIFWGPKKQCIFGKYTIWPSSPWAEYIQVIGLMVFKILTLCPQFQLYSAPYLLEDNPSTKSMHVFLRAPSLSS